MKPSALIYPESDGQPMAENTLQFQWIVTIKEGMDSIFRHEPKIFVAGDLFWYPVEGNNKIRQAPDTMVVFGRPKGHRGSYRQWEEGGIAPQVVFEILSPGNRFGEMQKKFRFYEEYGVEEYYIYDPAHFSLEGYHRILDTLEQIPDMNGWLSRATGVRFDMSSGELVLYGPDEQRFLTYPQLMDVAEQRQTLVEREKERADREQQRAEKLAAQLRALGIQPEN